MIILDAETSPFIDVSGTQMREQLRNMLAKKNISFRIARDVGQFRDVLTGAPGGGVKVDVYPSVAEAMADHPDSMP